MSVFGSPQHFRYELKFLVQEQERLRILRLTDSSLQPDEHGPDGLYRVTSQYYDSPDLTAYWEKLDGENFRHKYRLRYYGDKPLRPFFEIKHRYNRTISKERVALEPEGAERFLVECRGLAEIGPLAQCPDRAAQSLTERLVSVGALQSLRPTVTITYLRQAMVGRWDPNLRLTFDLHCQALRPGEFLSAPEGRGCPLEPGHPIVMEIKFNERIPCWLRDAVNLTRVQAVRFSKYAKGVEALQQARGFQQAQFR